MSVDRVLESGQYIRGLRHPNRALTCKYLELILICKTTNWRMCIKDGKLHAILEKPPRS